MTAVVAQCTGSYKTGCRCGACRRIHRLDLSSWRRRRAEHGAPLMLDSTGVTRRLQALMALGFCASEIAARTGLSRSSITHNALGRYATCTVAKHADVVAAYGQLQDATPRAPLAARTARLAASRGWVPPIAWDDDTIDDPATAPYAGQTVDVDQVAVLRAVTGDQPVPLNRLERQAAVALMTADGLSVRKIAERLGSPERSVVRDRAAVVGGGGG